MSGAPPASYWRCGPHTFDLSRPVVMGIVNITPDSFSDGGRFASPRTAIDHAQRLVEDGADLLDIGAESTRPGAVPVSADAELARLKPVLEAIVALGRPVSVDTSKPEVMRFALEHGVTVVNDVRGLRERDAVDVVAASHAGVCVMHMQGMPSTMQRAPQYGDVVGEVRADLEERAAELEARGIARDRIAIDPGFGFGKTHDHNRALLRSLDVFASTGYPVLVGVSRKGLVAHWSGRPSAPPDGRLAGSLAAALFAVSRGARIVRVHDVRETVDALRMWHAATA